MGLERIIFRTDTPARWETLNPVLKKGEPGLSIHPETSEQIIKFGDGVTAWNSLPGRPPVGEELQAIQTQLDNIGSIEDFEAALDA